MSLLCVNRSKRCVGRHNVRICKLDVVRAVVGLKSELQRPSLSETKILEQRGIQVVDAIASDAGELRRYRAYVIRQCPRIDAVEVVLVEPARNRSLVSREDDVM